MTVPDEPDAREPGAAGLQIIGSDTDAGNCTDETCIVANGTDQLIAPGPEVARPARGDHRR